MRPHDSLGPTDLFTMLTGVVHAPCPDCGVVECRASEVTIRVEATANTYRFRCPECSVWVARTAGPATVTLLLRSGARVESSALPLEVHERPANATPIAYDDIINFFEVLDQLPTFEP